MNLIRKYIASFDISPDGFSRRKIVASIASTCAIILAFKFGTGDNAPYLVAILLTYSLLALGIVTADQLLRFYNDSKGKQSEEKQVLNEEEKK